MENQEKREVMQNILDDIADTREKINDLIADLQIRIENEMPEDECDLCKSSPCRCDEDTQALRDNEL